MRFIALDVHRDFCEVAIAEPGGVVRLVGRVRTDPSELELFARSLGADDEVVLEATANALPIARLIEPHVARVVLANPKTAKALTQASAKTDKLDARALARLLAGGLVPEVWVVDEQTRVLRRRIARRAQLVKQRTREKNQIHAVLMRNLKDVPRRATFSACKGDAGSKSRSCPPTSARWSRPAFVRSTSSTARSEPSTLRSPHSRSTPSRCAA